MYRALTWSCTTGAGSREQPTVGTSIGNPTFVGTNHISGCTKKETAQ